MAGAGIGAPGWLEAKGAALLMAGQAGEGFGGLLLVGGWY
jgi:hypothetical protein